MNNIIYYRRTWERKEARALLWEAIGGEAPLQFGASGKPFLPGGPEFNLSHTGGLVVCALSRQPVGVDVEAPRPVRSALVERCLTPLEREKNGLEPPFDEYLSPEAAMRFLRVWTRKEALLKRDGRGLSAGLLRTETTGAPDLVTFAIGDYLLSFCGTPAEFKLKEL